MPVKLSDFTATKKENTVQLNWKTLSETNFSGFNIERSIDGKNFETIGNIVAKGTASEYTFVDNKLPTADKLTIYYRLKQLDNNGKFDYSVVKSLTINNLPLTINFYPNPAKNNLFVSLGKIERSNATINLIDITGKIVKTQTITNTNSNSSISIDVSNINKGVYFLVIKDGQNTNTNKVIVE